MQQNTWDIIFQNNCIVNLLTLYILASKDDQIYHVMKNMTGDCEWQTFNCYFNLLFGEDLRDVECCLLHICHGVEIDNPLL